MLAIAAGLRTSTNSAGTLVSCTSPITIRVCRAATGTANSRLRLTSSVMRGAWAGAGWSGGNGGWRAGGGLWRILAYLDQVTGVDLAHSWQGRARSSFRRVDGADRKR